MQVPAAPPIDALAEQLPDFVRVPELLPGLFDYSATFIWALSGALIAARRGYVGMGIVVIAIVSATGGGLIRDGMLLASRVPELLVNPTYVVLSLAAVLIVVAAGSWVDRSRYIAPAVHFVDALGAGVYAVVGVNRAMAAGLPLVGVVIVGVVNATGGGLLRDVLMRRVPDLFKPGLPLGPAAVLAAILFAGLVTQTRVGQTGSAFITIAFVTLLNLVMMRFHIRSRPLKDFRAYWESRD